MDYGQVQEKRRMISGNHASEISKRLEDYVTQHYASGLDTHLIADGFLLSATGFLTAITKHYAPDSKVFMDEVEAIQKKVLPLLSEIPTTSLMSFAVAFADLAVRFHGSAIEQALYNSAMEENQKGGETVERRTSSETETREG